MEGSAAPRRWHDAEARRTLLFCGLETFFAEKAKKLLTVKTRRVIKQFSLGVNQANPKGAEK